MLLVFAMLVALPTLSKMRVFSTFPNGFHLRDFPSVIQTKTPLTSPRDLRTSGNLCGGFLWLKLHTCIMYLCLCLYVIWPHCYVDENTLEAAVRERGRKVV